MRTKRSLIVISDGFVGVVMDIHNIWNQRGERGEVGHLGFEGGACACGVQTWPADLR